jgi:hypothetical protein
MDIHNFMHLFWRFRHRWEDNIKIGLERIVYKDVDWIYLAQDRVQWRNIVKPVIKFRVTLKGRAFVVRLNDHQHLDTPLRGFRMGS